MSKQEKLIASFINRPAPKWSDLVKLLKSLGYEQIERSGSRVDFFNKELNDIIKLHKLHPENTIKHYVKREILHKLTKVGFIK